jgi:putative addiction module CopG family antidote
MSIFDINGCFGYGGGAEGSATLNVSLTPKLETFVRQKVATGLYNNASEVIREALRRWVEGEGWDDTPRETSEATTVAPSDPSTGVRAAPAAAEFSTKLTAIEGRLRALGVMSLAWIEANMMIGRNQQEVEILLEIEPSRRFSVVDLASAKSLCEGAIGRSVRLYTGDGLAATTRQALESRAIKVF